MKLDTKSFEEKMKKSITVYEEHLSTIRAGRANSAVLKGVEVSYYGSPTEINAVAEIKVTDARTIAITPWDASLLKEIEKDAKRKQLTQPLTYREAVVEDIPRIMEIVAYAKKSLKRFHVDQWQGPYPNPERFEEDIRLNQCFVACHGDEVAGMLVLSLLEEPCYDDITDGKWTEGMEYTVIHRAAVAKEYRGTAVAEYLIRVGEELTRKAGRRCIRVDTHRKNKPMQNLLRNTGFRFRGNIMVEECGHDPHRHAFEKILKDKK